MSRPSISKIVDKLYDNANFKDLFRYNEYTNNIELTRTPQWNERGLVLTDGHVLQMRWFLDKTLDMDLNVNLVEEVCYLLSSLQSYHPIKDYLRGLKWDGVVRLDKWLVDICMADDNVYVRNAGKYALIAAVNRIFEPGCQFDSMLILEGEQGGGKSTMLQALGGQWYLDTQLTTGENKKDLIDIMRTGWIIEIADLAGFRKHEVDYLRSFITRKVDRVRLAYGRMAKDFPRQCIFIGTHNPSGDNQYLKDDTGNRRFWPIKCGDKIRVDMMKQWRDQLWAEAYAMYLKKEQFHFTDDESLAILKGLHEEREVDIPVNEKIEQYVANRNCVHVEDIFTKVFKNGNMGAMSFAEQRSKATLIGIYFRRNKWIKGTNKKRNFYFRPGFEYEEPTRDENVWDNGL